MKDGYGFVVDIVLVVLLGVLMLGYILAVLIYISKKLIDLIKSQKKSDSKDNAQKFPIANAAKQQAYENMMVI